MRSTDLHRLFRNVILTALVPSVSAAACGGATLDVDEATADGGASNTVPAPRATGTGTGPVDTVPVPAEETDARPPKRDASAPEVFVVEASVKDVMARDVACVSTPAPWVDAGSFPPCQWTVPLPCDLVDGGPITSTQCQTYCGAPAFSCWVGPASSGSGDQDETVLNCVSCAIGRRPEGYAPALAEGASLAGRYFATAAELEAASVYSFERLATELDAHEAPCDLVVRADAAANDERRHARVTERLAERFGGAVAAPRRGPSHVRPLAELGAENAAEGCVRETFGALVAHLQAQRAQDPRVRAAMAQIALDETEHAALAWSVASWLEAKVPPSERASLAGAMARAVDELEREVTIEPPEELRVLAGLPTANEAQALVGALRELLWAA